jgi:hypothetical protein
MKNYTTSIDYMKTVGEIYAILGSAGAKMIMVEHEDRKPVRVFFSLEIGNKTIPYRLPCNWEGILIVLQRESKLPSKMRTPDQALRVGWRCIKDWIESQLAFVESEMVQLHQVFLPYAVDDNNRTVCENFETKLLN